MGKLSAVTLALLQTQYRHETCNSLRYFARSSWARFRGLESIADFFNTEATGERKHAVIVQKIIEDRNEAVVPEPMLYDEPSEWSDIGMLFGTATAVELTTTSMLNDIYLSAQKEGDVQLMIAISELCLEQVEEENIYQTILDRIATRGTDDGTVHDIDVWIGEQYGERK